MHPQRSGCSVPAEATKQDTLTSAWCHPRSRGTIFFFPPVLPWAPSAHPICGPRFLFTNRSQNSPSLPWLLQGIITGGEDYRQKKCLHTQTHLQINRAFCVQTRFKDQLSHLSHQHLSQVLRVLAVSKHTAPCLPSLAQLFPRTPQRCSQMLSSFQEGRTSLLK